MRDENQERKIYTFLDDIRSKIRYQSQIQITKYGVISHIE